MRTSFLAVAIAAISIGRISSATGGPVAVPNTFTSGTPAKAADVNANFSAVATAVNGSAQDIANLKAAVKNAPAGPQGPVGAQGPPGSGGVLVVDSNGATVGRWTGMTTALMNINGHFVNVLLDAGTPLGTPQTGFQTQDVSGLQFFHLAADCSDTRYIDIAANYGAGPYSKYESYTVNNQAAPLYLFYPTTAPKQMTWLATESFVSGQNPLQPGTCSTLGSSTLPLAVAAYFDVSTLGFVAPFSLK